MGNILYFIDRGTKGLSLFVYSYSLDQWTIGHMLLIRNKTIKVLYQNWIIYFQFCSQSVFFFGKIPRLYFHTDNSFHHLSKHEINQKVSAYFPF